MAIPMSERPRAHRVDRFEPSRAVTEILKLAERPDVISLAGGLPDPRVFPLERVRESMERVLRDEGQAALNYGPNAGFTKLREWIAGRMADKEGVELGPEHILVVSGGVDGLNLAAMAMLDPGDVVLVEAPTYMVALHVFRTYDARIVPVASDDDGLDPSALEERLKELDRSGARPKLLYAIPSFQNPSGRTLDEARRRRVASICRDRGVAILEDHAYAELAYDRPAPPSFKAIDPENVVFVHTFSKIFGPGVRLGWVAAEPSFVERLGLCKLGTDQCANTLAQRLVYDYGRRGHIETQVADAIALYRRKRDRMVGAMRERFPASARFDVPGGGFFLWVRLEPGSDSEALLGRAIEEEKTAFVAGPPFFEDGSGAEFLRLSFSFVPESDIHEGIERLSRALLSASPEGTDRSSSPDSMSPT